MRHHSHVVRALAHLARAAMPAARYVALVAAPVQKAQARSRPKMRSRRFVLRAAAVSACLAVSTLGLAAAPAAPARGTTTPAGNPVTITYPGGDLVASIDDGGIDPAIVNNVITTYYPQGLHAPAGASLSDLMQASYQVNVAVTPGFSPPPTFAGGSISVSGSIITIDIPAADIQPNKALPGWLAGLIAGVAATVAAVVAWSLCAIFFGTVTAGVGLGACAFASTFAWTLVGFVVADVLKGVALDWEAWKGILASAFSYALGAVLVAYLTPILATILPGTMSKFGTWVLGVIGKFRTWLGTAFQGVADAVSGFLSHAAQESPAAVIELASANGLATPVATGTVTSGIPGKCMDAYGTTGSAADGALVAINDCNGNPAQNFTVWSNKSVSLYGRCLDTGGGTAVGTRVRLWQCNGAISQVWAQLADGSLLNTKSGMCLDDPSSTTTNGTQLQLWSCNQTAAQKWALPGGSSPSGVTPCDIYASGGTPCAAAYSTVRALYHGYGGPLYQVKRASDGTTADIGLLAVGGYANAAGQDSFCAGTTCTIARIYDQSPNHNDLTIEGAGGAAGADHGANAAQLPITAGGHKAYGVFIAAGTGYRDNATSGIAVGGQPEGMYMVASGTHVNSGCCFDFGNAETNTRDNGNGHMDAVNLGTECFFPPCTGSGPWVLADMENGLFSGGNGSNLANTGTGGNYVTAMLKNDGQTTYALKGGNAQAGGLATWWNGPLPNLGGYRPMQQEGAIVLGTGGDNSNQSVGSFFEGVMTAGYPSVAADDAVQANIVAAGYAGDAGAGVPPPPSGAVLPTIGETPSAAGSAVVHDAGASGAAASGYSSVFTVDASNGHLQETYLPHMGDSWTTQDLSAKYGTPPVQAGTLPVAVVHCGYTSVYTVDASNGDLQETYLPAIGNPWVSQDLSVNYGTPPTNVTPTAVVHGQVATSSCGWTSVYTINASNGDLQETYLSNVGFPGDPWVTQNLSAKYGTPAALAGTSPVSIVHCGWTSVYTVDANQRLQETYLSDVGFPGDPWGTQSLSANYGTPLTTTTPTAVVHGQGATATDSCGWTSVYTVDASNGHLHESYLSDIGFPGDPWQTQDLSARFGTPPVLPGTQPVALLHMGFTSVYTVDQGTDQLQETYLSDVGFPGDPWGTQSLSANYGSPPTVSTPIVLLHPDASGSFDWTSVFTVSTASGHLGDLQETYLSNVGFPGDPWQTQDLSARFGTPPVFVPLSQ